MQLIILTIAATALWNAMLLSREEMENTLVCGSTHFHREAEHMCAH